MRPNLFSVKRLEGGRPKKPGLAPFTTFNHFPNYSYMAVGQGARLGAKAPPSWGARANCALRRLGLPTELDLGAGRRASSAKLCSLLGEGPKAQGGQAASDDQTDGFRLWPPAAVAAAAPTGLQPMHLTAGGCIGMGS